MTKFDAIAAAGGASRLTSSWLTKAESSKALARLAKLVFIVFVFATFAAVSFNGFYQKWGLRDGDAAIDKDFRHSFVSMIEGEAHRPFVYRQLLPQAANLFDAALPDNFKEWLKTRFQRSGWWEVRNLTTQMRLDPSQHAEYLIRYYFVYYMCFTFMFAALFVMREIAREIKVGEVAATIAPCVFSLVFVYFMSMGGFMYDFPEVFFLSLAALLALRGQWLWLLLLTPIATYNKEVFLFFTLTLFPLLRARMTTRNAALTTVALAALAAATYLAVRTVYADNPGSPAESWLANSIRFYLDVRNLFAYEVNFGVVTPRGYSILTLVMIAFLAVGAWRRLAPHLQHHILLAPAINAPLVLVFCGPGEVRNFSLCFVALFLLIARNLGNWTEAADKPRALGAT